MIAEGTKAPDFSLRDADGKLWTLAEKTMYGKNMMGSDPVY